MPKKKAGMTAEEQSRSFNDAVRRMIDAGELNPTDADAALDKLVAKARPTKAAKAT